MWAWVRASSFVFSSLLERSREGEIFGDFRKPFELLEVEEGEKILDSTAFFDQISVISGFLE